MIINNNKAKKINKTLLETCASQHTESHIQSESEARQQVSIMQNILSGFWCLVIQVTYSPFPLVSTGLDSTLLYSVSVIFD